MRSAGALTLSLLLVAVSAARVRARREPPAPRYAITDLGPGPNGTVSLGLALGPTGQIAGCWSMPGGGNVPNHAWLWEKGNFIELWTSAPDGNSQANAINGKNQVAGSATVRDERGTRGHA